jgi:EAL domain-containing protein (putative c-di-GMP-specific phosphodiesterase class I)
MGTLPPPTSTGNPVAEKADYYRLRAEWLRLKNHVFDTNTELPTLPAVLDEVRKLLEDRQAVGLVYLDLGGGGGVEALHGWHAYDEIVKGFARSLADLRKDGLLEARDLVSVLSVRSDKFLVFFPGRGNSLLDAEGVESTSTRICQGIQGALTRHLTEAQMPLDFHDGHALLYRDPMLRSERSVHRALDEAMYMSLRRRARHEDLKAASLDTLLTERRLVTYYQPIYHLGTLEILGHEVFTRGPLGGAFEDSESLFSLAERTNRLGSLERVARAQALSSANKHLAPGKALFLNTSLGALHDPEVLAFKDQVHEYGFKPSEVVLEITERVAMAERRAHQEVLRGLKRSGFGIAIDDMGAGYSSLQAAVELEPDYLKFDTSLVRNIDRSLIKRSLLETLVEIAAKIGARVIAEGIEARSEFTTLRDSGVTFGQGHYLAPPAPVVRAS